MTDDERLDKNSRIREHGRLTKLKRKSQLCRVFRLKIDTSHMNQAQQLHLKMIFVEAKRLYNFALSFMTEHGINDFDTKINTVQCLDKDHKPVMHELQYLGSQMKQAVIQSIKHSLKALAALKTRNHEVGSLRFKSEYVSINLQQFGTTYRFYDEHHIGIQVFKERIRINGASQFWNIPDLEFANAKLLNLPDGYYLAVTTYQNKGGGTKSYKPEIGIDMGIKTSVTTSDSRKYKVLIEESERIKKCQNVSG